MPIKHPHLPNYFFFSLVHPCDLEDRDGCQHHCNKKGMETICSCNLGFVLNEDEKRCDKSESHCLGLIN